jgi:anti-sigma factor ChrR (cupin superfamily)
MNLEGVVSVNWRDVPAEEVFPGVFRRTLWNDETGAKALIVELRPHAKFPELDVHEPGPEEVFVISGVFNDGEREHSAGSFIHHPAGTSHVPQSAHGCTLFVFYPAG